MTRGSLPPGMQLTSAGLLSGTPTQFGVYSFTLAGCDTTTPQPQCANGSTSIVVNTNITLLQFNPPAQLPGGVQGQPYAGFQFVATGGTTPYHFTSASLPAGFQLSDGGYLSGSPSRAGVFNFSVSACDTESQPQCLSRATSTTITNPVPLLQILTTALPNAIKGQPYDQFLHGQGGASPLKWSLTTLPPAGLLLSIAGELKGTPTVSGSFTLNVLLSGQSNDTPAVSAKLALTITLVQPPTIPPVQLPVAYLKSVYRSAQLPVNGGLAPFTWTILSGSLPPGLSLSAPGVISGTPQPVGIVNANGKVYTFTVQVKDSLNQRATASLSITVKPAGSAPAFVSKLPSTSNQAAAFN